MKAEGDGEKFFQIQKKTSPPQTAIQNLIKIS
jgi:hypothetical protein